MQRGKGGYGEVWRAVGSEGVVEVGMLHYRLLTTSHLLTTYYLLLTTYYLLPTTYYLLLAAYHRLLATRYLQLPTCYLLRTSVDDEHINPRGKDPEVRSAHLQVKQGMTW